MKRIMGMLEGELGLKSLTKDGAVGPLPIAAPGSPRPCRGGEPTPNALLLNTCTIHNHADQKV